MFCTDNKYEIYLEEEFKIWGSHSGVAKDSIYPAESIRQFHWRLSYKYSLSRLYCYCYYMISFICYTILFIIICFTELIKELSHSVL
jgi:hypothetical protein